MSQIQFPNQLFGPGDFTAQVLDNDGQPADVLEAGQGFKIETTWKIGPLAALLLGGEWTVAAYAESIGPGPEKQIGFKNVPLNGLENYSATVDVFAGTLPNDPPPATSSGAYKVVTVLSHRNFNKISNVAAVVESPVLRIA
ncbi:hypothetical protein ACQP2F_19550 [Actinoplanes sp. CA-030573]|uniref:hypothetical protein n=1 Tax=Actinoplanes sp. CA-030573 TaxID=3239898 RepID=UPI003D921C82